MTLGRRELSRVAVWVALLALWGCASTPDAPPAAASRPEAVPRSAAASPPAPVASRPPAPPRPPASSSSSPTTAPSPLASCYEASSGRQGVGDCLRRRLRAAEERLAAIYAVAEKEAMALDGVRDGRANNHRALVDSHNRWKDYITAECDRIAEALRPGTGSGDALLDCRVRLTLRRARDVEETL